MAGLYSHLSPASSVNQPFALDPGLPSMLIGDMFHSLIKEKVIIILTLFKDYFFIHSRISLYQLR